MDVLFFVLLSLDQVDVTDDLLLLVFDRVHSILLGFHLRGARQFSWVLGR